ncbi:MAG: GAF domain-containing protein, partial [Chloroflexi bacterium]|nr:GAF domain-containing protein [Chloroflexota bacterium]
GQPVGVIELETWGDERRYSPQELSLAMTMANQTAVALDNARLFEAEHAAREQAETLRAATQALSATLDLQQVFDLILSELRRVVPYDSASVQRLKGERLEVIGGHGFPNLPELLGVSFDMTAGDNPNREVVRTRAPLILEDAPAIYAEFRRGPHAAAGIRSWLGVPLLFGDRLIGMIALDKQAPDFYTEAHARLALAFAAQAAVAIENARLYQQASQRLHELETLHRATLAVVAAPDLEAALQRVAALLADQLEYPHVGIALVDETGGKVTLQAAQGIPTSEWGPAGQGIQVGQGLVGWVAQHGQPLLVNDVTRDPRYLVGIPETRSELVVPLRTDGQVIGVINIESPRLGAFDAEDLRLLSTLAGQLATAIERARLFDETRRRTEELEALASVSATLRQARTRADMLPLLVEAAMRTLPADAGALLLVEDEALVFAAARGPGEALLGQPHPPGDDPLWQVVRAGQPLFVADVSEHGEFAQWEVYRVLMAGMTACACVPLQTAEATVGVLHLACRSRREATEGEIRLLTSIAEMAGNALHRAALHEQVARDTVELANAYEATLEGWAKALELRDEETEGHTRRVAEMTLRLARAMGMGEEDMVHVRRGALLHDIGKMGVPDAILLKPGELTHDERSIIRFHPTYAYDMLSPIAFLRPALDIPYCHHEKWDGTGYPRGLKGEEIPFAARIFAVADVYDALRCDRPYREGWPEEAVRQYICEQTGKHFDPKVVEVFLSLADGG